MTLQVKGVSRTVALARPVSWVRGVLWITALVGAAAILMRLGLGLGRTTNLSDGRAWGLWIGFDLTAIALAGAGFTMGTVVKVFHRRRFAPLFRVAILAALIGYLSAATFVFLDLGLPWRIWHPILYQNLHSPLFEVSVCVMLYTTVLFLEFAEIVAEGRGWHRVHRWLSRVIIGVVIAGIVLSTMHQSSLGTTYVLPDWRLSPLWKTSWLPLLFFLTAVAGGLSLVIVLGNLIAGVYGRHVDQGMLAGLGEYAGWVLLVYAVLRLWTFVGAGGVRALGENGVLTFLFLLEIGGGVILPLVVYLREELRRRPSALRWAALAVVLGVVLYRFNVTWFGLAGWPYAPSWNEWACTFGIMAGGALFFDFALRYLPIYEG